MRCTYYQTWREKTVSEKNAIDKSFKKIAKILKARALEKMGLKEKFTCTECTKILWEEKNEII